jgi:hypothetical protein
VLVSIKISRNRVFLAMGNRGPVLMLLVLVLA